MRTALVVLSQIACLAIIYCMGQFTVEVLRYFEIITHQVANWYIVFGRHLYAVWTIGLLAAAVFALVVGGTAQANRIVISESPLGRNLLRFWIIQNVILAILSASAFVVVYLQASPELRTLVLRALYW